MHEMGIAMQIIEIAAGSIPKSAGNIQVEKVNIKVGKLSAVVPESLKFCFDIVAKDTALSGARLVIEEVPVVAKCNECSAEWTISGPAFTCIKCNSGSIQILSGRELDIVSIEIADP
ncbi:MAG: hydrogenase maturation nickel metallochaperone HypA [Desulfobacteraceae bacterium]|nr:MAG: hydrogenase maturation nickel metallochaperone HypA [Desulfobacteraceae bacterium]